MIFKLAWRNIWRNPRRTWITMSSILFAVFFCIFLDALERGSWDNMIDNVVTMFVGYLQIHRDGYWDEKVIDNAMPWSESQSQALRALDQIDKVVPRLESHAIASSGNITRGVLLLGIAPEEEDGLTGLSGQLSEGHYLQPEDRAVLMGGELAGNLKVATGDTLVLISQGYHGVNAAAKYHIKGLLHFPSPDLNKQMVYLPIREAQWFFGAEGLYTTMALDLRSSDHLEALKNTIQSRLGKGYEVMTWRQCIPELVKSREMDVGGNYIIYFILYLIISFGIFGTILMMVRERLYEFGILLSIGMRRLRLSLMVWIESIILVICGALAGIAVSLPVILFFRSHPIRFSGEMAETLEKFGFEPIFPAGIYPHSMLQHAVLVMIIASLLSLFAVYRIMRLKPVEAMRQ